MKKFLQQYSWAFCLGASLSVFANIHFYNWQFYTIVIPVIALVMWSQEGVIK